ncbi:DUF4174 domain-containing protein [Nostoc sp. CHAB 5784]|uniref:DUF4174 domain-containing protein n=1 Tax=Nostoc mirabile TaxID=2907820 RepID=UPI001E442529|nr:DUF4174 domain-containing protein [Nostoc mirabile]MCC5669889.1 DUF4174 domain-containing protein [Nostoc mirabile CHAB5784]
MSSGYPDRQPAWGTVLRPSLGICDKRFGVDKENFRIILVGKDGGVKRQDTTPVQPTAIFKQIDAMPMRQQEMQERKRK